MQRDPRAYLSDIRHAAALIAEFLDGSSVEQFTDRPMLHSAVERQLEIVGEAVSQLAKSAPEIAQRLPAYKDVIAFRNLLIHGYAVVNLERVWKIAQQDLPLLCTTADAVLAEMPPPSQS